MEINTIKDKLLKNTDATRLFLISGELSDSSMDEVCCLKIPERLKYDSEEYVRIKEKIVNVNDKAFLLTKKMFLPIVNRLMWECRNVRGVVCLDSSDPYEVEEKVTKKDILLWDVQANRAQENDQAFMSGWNNSYNNEPFSKEELDEYIENNYLKLEPYIDKTKDVLEAGVGSGMLAFKMHEMCRTYDGGDISSVVLGNLRAMADKAGIDNMDLYQCGADQVNEIGKKYDVILMSSVTEYFSGYNYMRLVVKNCIDALKDEGALFFADVFDLDKKEAYRNSVNAYAKEHPGCRYKKDFSHELFIPREYWKDIQESFDEIESVEVTDKIGTYANEINLFRYDVLVHVKKNQNKISKIQLAFCEDTI